jgi:hypothetical protein
MCLYFLPRTNYIDYNETLSPMKGIIMFDKNWNTDEYTVESEPLKNKVKRYFIAAASVSILVSISYFWFINL